MREGMPISLSQPARANNYQLRTDAASQAKLSSTEGWKYVPLEDHYNGAPFTWRSRYALGFDNLFQQAWKVKVLGAGLIMFGPCCFTPSSALFVATFCRRNRRRGKQGGRGGRGRCGRGRKALHGEETALLMASASYDQVAHVCDRKEGPSSRPFGV